MFLFGHDVIIICHGDFMCLQIVECRRVLKWTYAYGFYLPEHEHAKRQFFEYLQGMLFLSVSTNMLLGSFVLL